MTTTDTSIPPAPPPVNQVARELMASSGFLLARLGMAFKARAIEQLEQAGFDAYHYSILAILAEGSRETQATIAHVLAVDPSRLVALLDSLEQRGLVVRQRDTQDRRRHLVSITEEGKRELEQLREITRQLEDEFLAPLDPETRGVFHELLTRLACYHDPRCAFIPVGPPS